MLKLLKFDLIFCYNPSSLLVIFICCGFLSLGQNDHQNPLRGSHEAKVEEQKDKKQFTFVFNNSADQKNTLTPMFHEHKCDVESWMVMVLLELTRSLEFEDIGTWAYLPKARDLQSHLAVLTTTPITYHNNNIQRQHVLHSMVYMSTHIKFLLQFFILQVFNKTAFQ